MVSKLNLDAVARLATIEKQTAIKSRNSSNPFDINIFDKVDISSEAKSASQTQNTISQGQSESNQRSKIFAGVFYANISTLGIRGASDLAFAAVRSEFSIDSNFPVYSPEKQSNGSIDISAYY